MKKTLSIISYIFTICLFCALFICLFDLACIGKISKFNHLWAGLCSFDNLACMMNYNLVCIAILLPILGFMLFYLIKKYHKQILFIPVAGFLLFILSIITCWGLV